MSETLTRNNSTPEQGLEVEQEQQEQNPDNSIGYSDLDAESKIRVKDSVDANVGNIYNQTAAELQHLGVEASLAGADKDTKLFIFNLMQSYENKYISALNGLANGENVLKDAEGLERLRKQAEADIARIKSAVENRQKLHEAEAAEEAKVKEINERSAREMATRAIEQQVANEANAANEQVEHEEVGLKTQEESVEPSGEHKPKLGYFERRRAEESRKDATRLLSDINRLSSLGYVDRAEDLTAEQKRQFKEQIDSYLDTLGQVMSGERTSSSGMLDQAERLRQTLENITVKVKSEQGESLTKDEQKILKKLKK